MEYPEEKYPKILFNGGVIPLRGSVNGGWRPAVPRVVEYAGIGYFVEDWHDLRGTLRDSDLPVEFYAHELMDVKAGIKTNNDPDWKPPSEAEIIESVTDFVSRWGLVFDPARYGAERYFKFSVAKDPVKSMQPYSKCYLEALRRFFVGEARRLLGMMQTNLAVQHSEAIEFKPVCDSWSKISLAGRESRLDGNSLIAFIGCEPAYSPVGELAEASGVSECPGMFGLGAVNVRAVSVLEAVTAIREAQKVVLSAFEWLKRWLHCKARLSDVKSDIELPTQITDFITGVMRSQPAIGFMDSHNDLLPAVFAQFADTLLNFEPWRICEYCERPFKRKQNIPSMQPKNKENPKRPPHVKYCCEKCRNDINNARKSKPAKARIDHGI